MRSLRIALVFLVVMCSASDRTILSRMTASSFDDASAGNKAPGVVEMPESIKASEVPLEDSNHEAVKKSAVFAAIEDAVGEEDATAEGLALRGNGDAVASIGNDDSAAGVLGDLSRSNNDVDDPSANGELPRRRQAMVHPADSATSELNAASTPTAAKGTAKETTTPPSAAIASESEKVVDISFAEFAKREEELLQAEKAEAAEAEAVAASAVAAAAAEAALADAAVGPITVAAVPAATIPVPAAKKRWKHSKKNYAAQDCGALVMASNEGAKSPSAVLNDNRDSYMLNTCNTANKFIIIELCEDIQIRAINVSNYEMFSSTISGIRVLISQRYPPSKAEGWTLLETFESEKPGEVWMLSMSDPGYFWKYLKLEFVAHKGNEAFCPTSAIEVFGLTGLEDAQTEAVDDYEHDDEDEIDDAVPDTGAETNVPVADVSTGARVANTDDGNPEATDRAGEKSFLGDVASMVGKILGMETESDPSSDQIVDTARNEINRKRTRQQTKFCFEKRAFCNNYVEDVGANPEGIAWCRRRAVQACRLIRWDLPVTLAPVNCSPLDPMPTLRPLVNGLGTAQILSRQTTEGNIRSDKTDSTYIIDANSPDNIPLEISMAINAAEARSVPSDGHSQKGFTAEAQIETNSDSTKSNRAAEHGAGTVTLSSLPLPQSAPSQSEMTNQKQDGTIITHGTPTHNLPHGQVSDDQLKSARGPSTSSVGTSTFEVTDCAHSDQERRRTPEGSKVEKEASASRIDVDKAESKISPEQLTIATQRVKVSSTGNVDDAAGPSSLSEGSTASNTVMEESKNKDLRNSVSVSTINDEGGQKVSLTSARTANKAIGDLHRLSADTGESKLKDGIKSEGVASSKENKAYDETKLTPLKPLTFTSGISNSLAERNGGNGELVADVQRSSTQAEVESTHLKKDPSLHTVMQNSDAATIAVGTVRDDISMEQAGVEEIQPQTTDTASQAPIQPISTGAGAGDSGNPSSGDIPSARTRLGREQELDTVLTRSDILPSTVSKSESNAVNNKIGGKGSAGMMSMGMGQTKASAATATDVSSATPSLEKPSNSVIEPKVEKTSTVINSDKVLPVPTTDAPSTMKKSESAKLPVTAVDPKASIFSQLSTKIKTLEYNVTVMKLREELDDLQELVNRTAERSFGREQLLEDIVVHLAAQLANTTNSSERLQKEWEGLTSRVDRLIELVDSAIKGSEKYVDCNKSNSDDRDSNDTSNAKEASFQKLTEAAAVAASEIRSLVAIELKYIDETHRSLLTRIEEMGSASEKEGVSDEVSAMRTVLKASMEKIVELGVRSEDRAEAERQRLTLERSALKKALERSKIELNRALDGTWYDEMASLATTVVATFLGASAALWVQNWKRNGARDTPGHTEPSNHVILAQSKGFSFGDAVVS